MHHTDGILHPPPPPHKAKVSHRFIIVPTDDNRCFRRVLDAGLTSIKRAMFEREEAIFHCRRQRNTATRWGSGRITPKDRTNSEKGQKLLIKPTSTQFFSSVSIFKDLLALIT